MKAMLDFFAKILTKWGFSFWMTTVHVVVPWKWASVVRVAKASLINLVICSIEGGTVEDKTTGRRRLMTGEEKQHAVYTTLSTLVYVGVVESEEALKAAIDGGVTQLNALKILNK